MSKRILGAAIGDCVHVAGLLSFLQLAQQEGYRTDFLGPAVPIGEIIGAALETDADIIAISYRLSPEAFERVMRDFVQAVTEAGLDDRRFIFGGTDPVCEVAKRHGLFEAVFGSSARREDVIAYLRGRESVVQEKDWPRDLIERIRTTAPYPVIRHHFGRPSLQETLQGVARIAEARVLDIISLGPDQNAQACFFRPAEMDPTGDGAGGVPVRTDQDLIDLYEAASRGNYPLMRCYSGTRDLLRWAEMLHRTINNAWCAVPLCWYNVLDGRSDREVAAAIAENQAVMHWHGQRGIPVEVNEAHHWSLRDAHDSLAVAMAYIAAYNAKAMGVRDYIAQFMFNNPPGISVVADLGKMLAKLELIEELADPSFRIWRQTRTGLSSYPADMQQAKGHLAASVFVQIAIKPHIVHVVSYSEADHAATAKDVIESCKIAKGVIEDVIVGAPDLTKDERVGGIKEHLVREAKILIAAVRDLGRGSPDPLADPEVLGQAIQLGIIDAPHLKGNPVARGQLRTRIVDGSAVAADEQGEPITESERLAKLHIQ